MVLPRVLLSLCYVSLLVSYVTASLGSNTPDSATNDVISDLIRRVERLEQRDVEQQRDITELQQQLSAEKHKSRMLEDTVSTLLKELSETNGKVNASTETNDNLNTSTKPNGKLNTSNENNLFSHSEKQRDLVRTSAIRQKVVDNAGPKRTPKGQPRTRQLQDSPMSVAFFSTLSNHQTHIGVNQSVAFDNVITDVGHAYNSHLGIFLAPVRGTYAFSVTLTTFANLNAHFNVALNGQTVSRIYIRGSESPSQTSSQTIVLHLEASDDVYIRNEDKDNSLNGGLYSSFAGFLIQEDLSTSTGLVGK